MAINPAVVKLESQIYTPALQEAMQQSLDEGYSRNDSIMAAANAYINMLVELTGKEKAQEMLESQAKFLQTSS